jgi:hypothetical protein
MVNVTIYTWILWLIEETKPPLMRGLAWIVTSRCGPVLPGSGWNGIEPADIPPKRATLKGGWAF